MCVLSFQIERVVTHAGGCSYVGTFFRSHCGNLIVLPMNRSLALAGIPACRVPARVFFLPVCVFVCFVLAHGGSMLLSGLCALLGLQNASLASALMIASFG